MVFLCQQLDYFKPYYEYNTIETNILQFSLKLVFYLVKLGNLTVKRLLWR